MHCAAIFDHHSFLMGFQKNFFSYITPAKLLKKIFDAYIDVKNASDSGIKVLSQKNFRS